jgi:hypothetical protein
VRYAGSQPIEDSILFCSDLSPLSKTVR